MSPFIFFFSQFVFSDTLQSLNFSLYYKILSGAVFFFGILYFFFKRGIGLGDIKLLIILGTAVGFLGSYYIFCLATMTAALVIGILFLVKKVNHTTYFPFVPFIYFSFICYMTFQ
ncbi:prepilin peptidase [Listeria costaricensis]|uniref:prepilin peptidase n=1 Tax=Listeria costaricensis TaxID=2026604 RepID=UPI000C08C35E